MLAAVTEMNNKGHFVAGGDSDHKPKNDYYGQVFTQRLNLWRIRPVAKRYMLHPDLADALPARGGQRIPGLA